MASEELQRRILNLIGESKGAISDKEMEAFMQSSPEYSNQQRLNDLTSAYVLDLIGNSKGAISNKEMEAFMQSSPNTDVTEENQDSGMSDQELNMLMANQGAREGLSAVENRGLSFAKFLRDTDRTAPEEVINNYAMGVINFPTAIGMAQPLPTVDEIVVTGQMPDMSPTRRAVGSGMLTPLDRATLPAKELITNMGIYEPSASDTKLMELQQALEHLERQMQMTNDPEEKEILGQLIENARIKAFAPQADLVDQLSQGAGEDDMMVHVRSGDINVSREMLENNPVLEDMIEQAAIDAGVDPESMVYGTGIASLNEITGAEQHGLLKKIAKGVKKVVKKIAPVAAIIPGPWQAPALAYNRGRAVVNIATGKGGIGDLMTAAGGFAGDGKMGKFFGDSKIGKAFGDSKIGKFFGGTPGINPSADATGMFGGTLGPRMRSGIGNLFGGGEGGSGFFNPAEGTKGIFGGSIGPAFRRGIGGLFGGGGQGTATTQEDGSIVYKDAEGNVITQEEYEKLNEFRTPQLIKSVGDAFGFGGRSGLRDVYGGEPMRDADGNIIRNPDGSPVLSGFMRNAQGGLSGGAMLGLGALATGLGKLAYEDTKKQEGVQLTPLLTMNAAGRYNLEAEMARRMGQRPPNPTEFGLLPANTMPQLSGCRPQEVVMAAQGGEIEYPNKGLEALSEVAPDVVKRMGYNMGGYVMPMAYAEGGNVAVEDFKRMNGQINGEGTETSDDVPAMLSDGEFVMTGQAVRGAGTYDMKNNSGIITLSPTGSPSRDGGTDLMYKLMEAFSSQARPA